MVSVEVVVGGGEWGMPEKECYEINPERTLNDTRDHQPGSIKIEDPEELNGVLSFRPT